MKMLSHTLPASEVAAIAAHLRRYHQTEYDRYIERLRARAEADAAQAESWAATTGVWAADYRLPGVSA